MKKRVEIGRAFGQFACADSPYTDLLLPENSVVRCSAIAV
jgi:hypothetical protein